MDSDFRTAAGAARKLKAVPDPSRVQDLFLKRLEELEKRVTVELERPATGSGPLQELLLDAGRELWRLAISGAAGLADPTRIRRALAQALAAGETDEFGVDHQLAETVREIVKPLARLWLGLAQASGATLAERGGALIVFNRSAWPFPVEAVVLWALLHESNGNGRRVFALWDEQSLVVPFVGDFLQRIGIVSASEDNAMALLERGAVVVGFPEGRAALEKTYERRYRLERFEDARLIAAAMDAGAQIVPGAVTGNEESFTVIGKIAGWPLTPLFPVAGLLGLVPLPLTWSVRLGAPVEYVSADQGTADVDGVTDAVRARVQALLGELLSERDSIVSG